MAYTLDFVNQVVGEVPCYELGFLPDENVIDCIRSAAQQSHPVDGMTGKRRDSTE